VSIPDAELLKLVHANEPSAAAPLYECFAKGVRTILRHKLPDANLEIGVFHVLVTVARAIRQARIQDPDQLPCQILAVINAYVARSKEEHRSPTQELQRALGELEPQEREILARFYRLEQSDERIRREMKIPQETVSSVRKTSRARFVARSSGSNPAH